jgi:hypothetical protein
MNITFRYGNQLLVGKKLLWSAVYPMPSQEYVTVDPQEVRTILSIGNAAIDNVLATYPEVFFMGLRSDDDIRFASPSPFAQEGYARTTGVTADMSDLDPAFYEYWRTVEDEGRNKVLLRMANDAAWLMLARRD